MTPDSWEATFTRAGPPTYTRCYLIDGREAHLREDVTTADTLCFIYYLDDEGNEPPGMPGPDDWLGTGSQEEYEHAASLPLCLLCFGRREQLILDPRLGTGHGTVMT